jgi:hypothetical protein
MSRIEESVLDIFCEKTAEKNEVPKTLAMLAVLAMLLFDGTQAQ